MLGLNWYNDIYSSIVGNIDLYISGMIIAYGQRYIDVNKKLYNYAWLLLLCMLVFNSYCYYFGELDKPILLSVYRYVSPSVYIVILSLLLVNSNKSSGTSRVNKLVKCVAKYSFAYYLWHSLILTQIGQAIIPDNMFNRYLAITFIGAACTVYVSIVMTGVNSILIKRKK